MDRPQYKPVNWRTVVRCDACGSWLETRHKQMHTSFHMLIVELMLAIEALKARSVEVQDEIPF